ncbi:MULTISPECIES: rod shape-determining protein MreD [unclassified Moraxella]|uniref:rod shape-determining protein MreD n=1 Tax=unclassified Moraxella TaxID=2685852 RepID=UPI002B40839C|nr:MULTISPECIES: rod shape-determining protein MreD [unclassified Moraxella]
MNSMLFLLLGIVSSFVVASAMNVYPLSFMLANFRPMFLVLVLVFWLMYRPTIMRVWVVFLIGLVSDLLLDTHLGHQAFCAVLMSFGLRVLLIYIKELTLKNAWLCASIALITYRLLLGILESFGHGFVWAQLGSLLMSILVFPLFWYPLYWINGQLKERAW